jgi:hypothetical protein
MCREKEEKINVSAPEGVDSVKNWILSVDLKERL